jgi:hypothetical protein
MRRAVSVRRIDFVATLIFERGLELIDLRADCGNETHEAQCDGRIDLLAIDGLSSVSVTSPQGCEASIRDRN